MKTLILIYLFILPLNLYTQNCNAYKYYGDTLQYEACQYVENAGRYYQFSREYQEIYDQSLSICPYFAKAFHAKSVAYLKSGDFLTWKVLIDKAVALKPTDYLGYRGWCRYQFFRDYEGAIVDFERLDSLVDYNIGYSAAGAYQLNIAKAICYKAIGQTGKAIEIIEEQLGETDYTIGMYDNLHLGVLYLETKQYPKAIEVLTSQANENNLAEVQFYKALCFKELKQVAPYIKHLEAAKKLYLEDRKTFDPYTHLYDKVYLKDIENELTFAKTF